MKKISIIFVFLFVLCAFNGTFAYIPSDKVADDTAGMTQRLTKYLSNKSASKRESILKTLNEQLPALQLSLMKKGKITKAYQLEYLRRHLPGAELIDTPDLVDDDGIGITWTHAPQGFDVMYFPYETPAFGSLDPDDDYGVLVNGGYFKRTEGGTYHAGVLWIDGFRQTPFEENDPQITHIVCVDAYGFINFWPNSLYREDRLSECETAFQAGPLVYSRRNGAVEENLMPKTYLGLSHNRTVMVVFDLEDGTQDTWFLTAYEDKTFEQIRDIVLMETRFYGEYGDISIMNLDGGSSVAYVATDHPELNFGLGKKLPIVFGIK